MNLRDEALLLSMMTTHQGNPAKAIEAAEAAAANGMDQGDRWQIPLKDEQFSEFAACGFADFDREDDLLVNVTPPQGWTLKPHGPDARRRRMYAADGEPRGSVFLKDVSYDRVGASSLFSDEYRRELAEEAAAKKT